jgi:hypothetical protein
VRKRGGEDHGCLYALKTIYKEDLIEENNENLVTRERITHEKVNNKPCFLQMQYAFQTKANLHIVTGEYFKSICMVVEAP